jgi:hypothetical protein
MLPSLRDKGGSFALLRHPARKGRDLTRWTLYSPALIVAAVSMACAAAVASLALSEKAEATFPGKNGRIAYPGGDGNDGGIYTINAGGGGKSRVIDTQYFTSGPSWGSRP